MVHVFSALCNYFALDVESGSVFLIDKLTFLLCLQKNGQQVDLQEFSLAQIQEAEQELLELEQNGVLFSQSFAQANPTIDTPIKAMCLNISFNCNLRCAYCFAKTRLRKDYDMSLQTAKNAVDFLIAHSQNRKNLEIDFFGGEPLLNLDVLKSTVEYANLRAKESNKHFNFTFTTNCLALTPEHHEWLNQNMFNVVLSIDGRKDVHNQVRKAYDSHDSYQTILQNALQFASKRGDKQCYVRGTFTANNLDFDQDVLYLNDLGFKHISIEPVVLDSNHALAIKHEHLPIIEASYQRLAQEYLKRRQNKDTWFSFFHFMLDLQNSPCEKKLLSGCGAGLSYVSISPNGDIFPCHCFCGAQEFFMGNVNSAFLPQNQQKLFGGLNDNAECSNCFAKYFCGGGCKANNFAQNHDVGTNYSLGCALMKMRLQYALAVYALENQNI